MEICVCVRYDIIGRYDGNCVCGMSCHRIVLVICLCFAEISIYFRFSEFRANSICPIFREGHAEFLHDFDACTHFYNQFVYYYRAGIDDEDDDVEDVDGAGNDDTGQDEEMIDNGGGEGAGHGGEENVDSTPQSSS